MGPISSKITLKKKKEKERRKERTRRKRGGEEKKSNGCTLSFYNGYFRVTFLAEKKLLDAKVPFGGNVFKIPARNINRQTCT